MADDGRTPTLVSDSLIRCIMSPRRYRAGSLWARICLPAYEYHRVSFSIAIPAGARVVIESPTNPCSPCQPCFSATRRRASVQERPIGHRLDAMFGSDLYDIAGCLANAVDPLVVLPRSDQYGRKTLDGRFLAEIEFAKDWRTTEFGDVNYMRSCAAIPSLTVRAHLWHFGWFCLSAEPQRTNCALVLAAVPRINRRHRTISRVFGLAPAEDVEAFGLPIAKVSIYPRRQ